MMGLVHAGSSMGFGSHSLPILSTEGSGRGPVVHQNSSVTTSSGTVLPSDSSSEPVAGVDTFLKLPRRTDKIERRHKSVEGCEYTADRGSGHLELPGTQFVGHGFHPLRHAVMGAIEMAAARDRRLFPSDRNESHQDFLSGNEVYF